MMEILKNNNGKDKQQRNGIERIRPQIIEYFFGQIVIYKGEDIAGKAGGIRTAVHN